MNNDKLTIAERIRAATIADSDQEGVNIAKGRFGSAMASLCRELDANLQGEPVACLTLSALLADLPDGYNKDDVAFGWNECIDNYRHPAEQPAPVAVVPDGYCIMPKRLTAENGAKALLLGEFKFLVTRECPECCELEEPAEGCEICDGEGEYGQQHTIPWDQIKFIYSVAVKGLTLRNESK
ncbi:hypothetical protein [Pseudomonas sp.]|uniref:hypothetical protein n=1 Tax=Pseudomonas sp. TaxID=306 RepID=UPI003FD7D6BC